MSGPEYIIFVGVNILKTLKRLATTTKCFSEKLTFLKTREILIDNNKS